MTTSEQEADDAGMGIMESLSHVDDEIYALWKRHGHHLSEYASELAGTAFLAFAVVAVVTLMFAKSSPVGHVIPSVPLRLLLAGLLIGGSGWLVAISPPEKLSGAHINPAVSIGFFILNKMFLRDTLFYIVAQMVGGIVGALLAVKTLGPYASEVHDAVLIPAANLNSAETFGAEFATTFVLAGVIFYCVSHPKIANRTPAFVTLSAGVLVFLDGNLSGAGMNPARWIGPALITDVWHLGWLYVLAPIFGASTVALIRRVAAHPIPRTAKLFHDVNYRSIFKHDHAPSTPPASVKR